MSQTPLSRLFACFATANTYPTPDTVNIYTEGLLRDDFVAAWRELQLPEEPLAEYVAALDAFVGKDSAEVLGTLRREYTRLFHTQDRLVLNCQGPWTSKKKGRKNVLFMVNETSTEISDFMYRCGIVRKAGYNDSLDSVENEWWFCSRMADVPAYLTEKGIDPLERLDTFIDTYLKAWLPGFAEDVTTVTTEPYFAALVKFQVAFLELY